jgi:hypothetical protein
MNTLNESIVLPGGLNGMVLDLSLPCLIEGGFYRQLDLSYGYYELVYTLETFRWPSSACASSSAYCSASSSARSKSTSSSGSSIYLAFPFPFPLLSLNPYVRPVRLDDIVLEDGLPGEGAVVGDSPSLDSSRVYPDLFLFLRRESSMSIHWPGLRTTRTRRSYTQFISTLAPGRTCFLYNVK